MAEVGEKEREKRKVPVVLTCFSSLAMEARSTLSTDCAISSPTEGWVRELSNSQAEDSICRYCSNSCSQTGRELR